jgi:hypothetical protein
MMTAMARAVLGLVCMLAVGGTASAARLANGMNAPKVVRVDPKAPLPALYAALEPLCGEGREECLFVFGRLEPTLPRTPVRIECAGARPIRGFIVRGVDLHARLLDDPRVEGWALLMWADGELWLTHPSGPGRHPLPDEPTNLAVDFFAKSDGRVGALVRAFARAAEVLGFIIVGLR